MLLIKHDSANVARRPATSSPRSWSKM